MARCPSCQSIVAIPGNDAKSAEEIRQEAEEVVSNVFDPPQSVEELVSDAFQDDDNKPFQIGPETVPSSNPFAGPAIGGPSSSVPSTNNPYQATATTSRILPDADANLRSRLKAAGIMMLVVSIPGCLYSLSLFLNITLVKLQGFNRDPMEFIILFLFMVGQTLSLAGSIAMLMRKNRSLAIVGSICQILTGWCCLCIPLFFGIYSLSVLTLPNMSRVMNSE